MGSESFQERRILSLRRMNAPLRLPISSATDPVAGFAFEILAEDEDLDIFIGWK